MKHFHMYGECMCGRSSTYLLTSPAGMVTLLLTYLLIVPTGITHHLWYTECPKIGTPFLYALTLQNIKQFSKLFHCQNRRKFVITISLKIPSHLKCVATLPYEMSSVLKATTDNKTTSITTYFKKLTAVNNVFIVSVIV